MKQITRKGLLEGEMVKSMGNLKRVEKKMAQIERTVHVERKNRNVDETGNVTGESPASTQTSGKE